VLLLEEQHQQLLCCEWNEVGYWLYFVMPPENLLTEVF
jgi:hypothetical protein